MAIKKLSELDPNRPQPAPLEYVGQWVAWNREMTQIVAHGESLEDAHRAAVAAGYPQPVLEHVPEPTAFIGVL
jgi:hypothetical protein